MNDPWYKVVFGQFVRSRKAMAALIGAIASAIVTLGGKVGLGLDTQTVVILVTPIITGATMYIYGTAHEDAAEKSSK